MRCSLNVLMLGMAVATCVAALAQTPTYNRGRTPSAEEIRAWDISIGPEGKELPPGSGTAKEGATLYAQKGCPACHGPTAAEIPPRPTPSSSMRFPLVGGHGTLTNHSPVRTVGSYFPFATTVWDFINRAMPPDQAGTLSADQVYALTAFLLYRNGIIKESDVMDATSLTKIQMPNRNGFVPRVEDIRLRRCPIGNCP